MQRNIPAAVRSEVSPELSKFWGLVTVRESGWYAEGNLIGVASPMLTAGFGADPENSKPAFPRTRAFSGNSDIKIHACKDARGPAVDQVSACRG